MLRVIIADDELKICKLIQVLVDWESLGFEIIDVVHDGKTLKEKTLELKPDLVVSDIRMPGCTGVEFLQYIREQNIDIEVLIISGYRDFEYVRQALRYGAADYLLKPLGKDALKSALKKILEKHNIEIEEKETQMKLTRQLSLVQRAAGRNLLYDILGNRTQRISRAQMKEEYHCDFKKQQLYAAVIKIDIEDKNLRNFRGGGGRGHGF